MFTGGGGRSAKCVIKMGARTVIDQWKYHAVIVCGLWIGFGSASAETAYVTDSLQLGVHQLPDTSDRAFTQLKSGERVETSEENRYRIRVTLKDGRTGWVKKNYLVTKKPAILRVAEVEQERDEAIAELKSLASGLKGREARISEIEVQLAAREAGAEAEMDELVQLRVENVDLAERLAVYAFSVPGTLFFVAAAASFVVGFLLSWWWFDHRARLRHGGFRIH